ncbi:response regulator transcription factor [Teredinibacter franksiae]|jgi:Response regulators consisting of a CheY-like receiver domain and a winged-helix DNA-binding domain|uniref:response regulator transcription factor n=1 Tax=Teredinibacter franksiae TaxID=2761453 RepID=UPI001626A079|nr:response regulator transcription factor [Teredinibacter franksiae]
MKIGFLEDDIAQTELLLSWLGSEGHEIVHASNGADFLKNFVAEPVDLIILDWELPDTTGIEILKALRQQFEAKTPVLFTTQRDSEEDIVSALREGADDYLVKPVRQAELLARIAALSRRAGIKQVSDVIEVGPITLDCKAESICVGDETLKVTRKDYLVALHLFRNIGKILSREYLLKAVWGTETGLDTRKVDVHVSRVRRSLKISPEMGYTIKTIYQHGYRLEKINT